MELDFVNLPLVNFLGQLYLLRTPPRIVGAYANREVLRHAGVRIVFVSTTFTSLNLPSVTYFGQEVGQ